MPKDETAAGHNSAEGTIDYGEVQAILDELVGKQTAISEATGELRSRIKAILDEQTWHKSALADIRKIDAMSDTKRADYLRTFEDLFDVMMAGKWRQSKQDMLDAAAENGLD